MIYDVIIIGAGAAGLMTAIKAQQGGAKVLLLEGSPKVGAKILMSGGTRCNVTNKSISEKDYNSTQLMTVRNILRAFDNKQAIAFFNGIGVELVLEETGKYFPVTNSGKTVLDALLKAVGPSIKTNCKVNRVSGRDGLFDVAGSGFVFQARNVVLATGGLSYPTTGSDGVGYRLAAGFGHQLIKTDAALTPLTTEDKDYRALAGITLPVCLTMRINGKKAVSFADSFLFAHFGFSGPAALDISRHWVRAEGRRELTASFLPQFDEAAFERILLGNPNKQVKSILVNYLPLRLVEVLLKKAGVSTDLLLNKLSKDKRQVLLALLLRNPLAINGVVGYSKAEVTAGGIDFAQINSKTLESKLQPGLFFTGEILDVDGRIGGFNFQWAWASGQVVGSEIIKRLERKSS